MDCFILTEYWIESNKINFDIKGFYSFKIQNNNFLTSDID